MVPISGRLPDDLYGWLATFSVEGATTVSDKIRFAVLHLKRMQEGDSDYMGALSMYRDLGRGTREHVANLERQTGQHSEVLAALMEHLPVLVAALHTATVVSEADAKQLETVLVRRTFQLAETILRQAVTERAAAFDPQVVTHNVDRLLELVRRIPSNH